MHTHVSRGVWLMLPTARSLDRREPDEQYRYSDNDKSTDDERRLIHLKAPIQDRLTNRA